MSSHKCLSSCLLVLCAVCLLDGCASYTYTPRVTPGPGSDPKGITSLNHIIFMEQENHSLDSYFGALREYWAENGYSDESFDGLPQFNPVSGAAPLYGPPPSNPGCNPDSPPPDRCHFDPDNPVVSFHFQSVCDQSPGGVWGLAHYDWDFYDPTGLRTAKLNGFVYSAALQDRIEAPRKIDDMDGFRAMGYYNGEDLNYYYFMASDFATSDRWFHPAMTHTLPNREYLYAGTSEGYAEGNAAWKGELLTAPTIFQELQDAGISWKIYVNPVGSNCAGPPYDPACLVSLTYARNFAWSRLIASRYPQSIAPLSQYFTDVEDGTLPQVAQIEIGGSLDEHPARNVQIGARQVSKLINALMKSTSWKDSVFILTYDESGGFYDHVSPQPEPSPDGIKPVDLRPGDVCTRSTGPTCDFVYTGYRIPLLVISPFAKKHYVSHTVADTTAILKLIETRFKLSALTMRDAAQMDMTEFFDFSNPPWTTPPVPPKQNMDGVCKPGLLP